MKKLIFPLILVASIIGSVYAYDRYTENQWIEEHNANPITFTVTEYGYTWEGTNDTTTLEHITADELLCYSQNPELQEYGVYTVTSYIGETPVNQCSLSPFQLQGYALGIVALEY